MTVKDKVILVTGGAGGLGAVMVELLCKNGAKLYILDLDETKGKELEAQLTENKVTATFIQMDLTSEEAWKQTIDTIVAKE
ncbi:MAG: hypothetical protein PWP59_2017, partial [Sphaerochaeta sp.]|nr:hypothetical protein [Sphaerochaeta sp.]